MVVDTEDLLTVAAAAKILQSSRICVWRWARQGKIKSVWISRKRFLLRASVLAFQEKQREPKKRKI